MYQYIVRPWHYVIGGEWGFLIENSYPDIVVVGASAGGVEALVEMARSLPADLPAAIFVVLHIPPDGERVLHKILDRAGPLPAIPAEDEMAIETGRIYVAPPDHHLLIEKGIIRLSNGPRENRHRPAVDPLFRSAARAYGPGVIGIVLSGTLDDGTLGLAAVKLRGGLAVVQSDPLFPGMPNSARERVEIDYAAPASEIGPLLSKLTRMPLQRRGEHIMPLPDAGEQLQGGGKPSAFSCPDCHGVLWEIEGGELLHYRCRVGHTYGVDSLSTAQTEMLEEALWAALRALEEKQGLAERLAARSEEQGQAGAAKRFREQAREAGMRAGIVQAAIREGLPLTG